MLPIPYFHDFRFARRCYGTIQAQSTRELLLDKICAWESSDPAIPILRKAFDHTFASGVSLN